MQYNLVFSTDKNYLPHLFVACQSILNNIENRESNSTDELVFNVLVDSSVDLAEAQNKSSQFEKRNQFCCISHKFIWHLVDISLFNQFNSMSREGQITYSTYYRIVIDRILPKEISFAAYLDIDMLVLADIRKLFDDYPLTGKVLGAVIDPSISSLKTDEVIASYKDNPSKVVKVPKREYFNAGVLLINLNEWRKQNLTETCLEMASKLNLVFHDQDLLNIICVGKVELIDVAWNFQPAMFYVLYNKETDRYDIANACNTDKHWACVTPCAEDFERAATKPFIVHFNGMKPWVNEFYNIPFLPLQILCPRLYHYREQWNLLERQVPEYPCSHNTNINAVNPIALEVHKLNLKRRKDRNFLQYLIALSLSLNIMTILLLVFDII